MADDVILVEISLTSPTGVGVGLRYADRAIPPMRPSDPTRANLAYGDRLIVPPSLRRMLFEDAATLSPTLAVGMMTLANADAVLNPYAGHVWGEITAYAWRPGTNFATARTLLHGLCAPPIYDDASAQVARVRVPLYDQRAVLSKPLPTPVYSGLNGVGGVLYEGSPDGLKGRAKPLAFGNLVDAHIPAPQVNPGLNVYQVHAGSMAAYLVIFDRGDAAGYINDGDLAGSAFDAATPAAAHFVTDFGRGLVKINGSPVGQVTFGLAGQASGIWGAYVDQPELVAGQILERALGGTSAIGGDFGDGAAIQVGIFDDGSTSAEQLIAEVVAAAPCAVLPDNEGVWRTIKFGAPAAEADISLAAHDVIDVAPDDTVSLPAGEVRVGWGKIYKTFSSTEIAPDLRNTAAGERLAADYRWAVEEDPAVKARLPDTWRKLEIRTALRLQEDAEALAAKLMALFGLRPDGKPRRQWRVILPRTDQVMDTALGRTVALDYPARSIDDNFLLIGTEPLRPKRDQVTWTLWG